MEWAEDGLKQALDPVESVWKAEVNVLDTYVFTVQMII